jgi:hypothetical protein
MKCRIEHKQCENYKKGCILEWPKCKYQSVLPGIHQYREVVKFSAFFTPKAIPIKEIKRSSPREFTTNPHRARIYTLKGKTPKYTDISGCTICGEVFNSTFAFEHHRVGPYTDRRCLSEEEMTELGMCKNSHGRWITEEYIRNE